MASIAALCSALIVYSPIYIPTIVLYCLYANPNNPEFSIVDFSVPALNKTSNETIGDIYIDLKLQNKNKAVSLYYLDPFNIAISYYPLEQPSQKYVWEYTLLPFLQGNGKSEHIRMLIGQPSSTVFHKEYNTTGKVVSFRIDLVVSYQFNYWVKGDVNKIETGADVVIDAATGNSVSKDKIELESEDSDEADVTTYQLLCDVAAGDVSHMNFGIFISFVIYSYVALGEFNLKDNARWCVRSIRR